MGGSDDLLLKCLGKKEQLVAMIEVHEGICRARQTGIKMRRVLRRHGYYSPTILKDCINYAKGCQDYQRHDQIQHVSVGPMNPIMKVRLSKRPREIRVRMVQSTPYNPQPNGQQ
ncbi:hypothetical protein L3X38_001723 [Prunus dulcis]|uniref:Integrase zinc-binding domain-containing protein n=1 Tax=Prunus dulcis TaxID=3755 RepID=A0AAD4WT67_PRUDU|nr:hypothetical protein L3X38_001723 [Prunus dulcis]